ncbi:hypothetical protein SDRG_13824 [Saprolegnia diclina VS20]|uniref:Golgi apparatus membrane protein TVP15 n=1 Tax=Saprolegnia diclina (strain VS20) TaxID=1156394 RepID=T0Q1U5_SAPDV|nr:hypothetical protein SDRG_13824 [Saprolegnia diclina VS20]EQC28496.1 hypothetical protein SDRG_13824 [Saprolegnia diclina VS20]|eukprot:XP_008618144.1 hypothetical protein SDRG_13824 [Saprolegnia diclina VS20]
MSSLESSSPSAKTGMVTRISNINKMELPKVLRLMRLGNVGCSIFQVLAGLTGLTSFITLNITGTLVSIYVIMFGLLFLLFECRLSSMEGRIRSNFGFLYSYKGRACFIFFIGFLDFGMSTTLGTIAGVFMCINALLNLLVMCKHPEFKSGHVSRDADPTLGYSSGQQEAAAYLSANPNVAMQASTFALSAAAQPKPVV